ncbi:response regulator, partial [bacterium]|nr:response regulator [bacterium]
GRDITDRRELEEKLRHAEKLEAIGQLAGGIAHDFNNIMTGIFGYCDLLEGELVRKSRASEYVREITDAAERAADLTSKLLAFSRKQVIEAIDLNINDAIEKAVGLLKRVLGEHIELDVIPGHNLGTVFADPSQISQIIMNLAVNARDAMLEGGKLTIETENVAINGAYCETHPWAKPGRYVLLSVADTGCGIPPDVLKHVFEPFFTTKDVDKGTGLGLATVYGIIKQHEGMVNIYSEVGKGTSVKIYLPIVERKAAEIGTKVEKKVLGGEETILLVEDDETVRQMTSRLLENAGYTIILATNGIEAVNIFRKKGDSIDLVLTDMMMPKMSGDEVCEKVRNIRENIKCIISSGYSIQSLPSALKGQSGIPILTKPFSPDALLRSVREVLDTGEGESAQN